MLARIRKNDEVMVVAGRDKGRRGTVLRLLPNGKVLVEKVHMVKKHMKPGATNRTGGIVEKEAPLAISNIMPICKECDAPRRIRVKRSVGSPAVRICVKCESEFSS